MKILAKVIFTIMLIGTVYNTVIGAGCSVISRLISGKRNRGKLLSDLI